MKIQIQLRVMDGNCQKILKKLSYRYRNLGKKGDTIFVKQKSCDSFFNIQL